MKMKPMKENTDVKKNTNMKMNTNMNTKMNICEQIKQIAPYTVVKGPYKIWLDKNENPFDIPLPIKEELCEELKKIPFNRYPSGIPDSLREKIAHTLQMEKENIMLSSGSDELISCLLKLLEGETVIISSPTFGMYKVFAALEGLHLFDVPLDGNFHLQNVEDFAENARAIFVCSPNNPTGNTQKREKIMRILDTGAPVILDEAYIEFAKESCSDLIWEYDNLVILRTFSKACGLAGVRVGYAVAQKEVCTYIKRIQSPFSVNVLSAKAAEIMLDHYDVVEQNIKFVIKERERIKREFSQTFPSEANFLLIDADAYEFLLGKGIVVRKLGGSLEGMIRVTVGKREENSQFISALKEFLE